MTTNLARNHEPGVLNPFLAPRMAARPDVSVCESVASLGVHAGVSACVQCVYPAGPMLFFDGHWIDQHAFVRDLFGQYLAPA